MLLHDVLVTVLPVETVTPCGTREGIVDCAYLGMSWAKNAERGNNLLSGCIT